MKHGNYDAQIKLLENGRVVAQKQMNYEKKRFPEWFGNSLGISQQVPPPWTPVKYRSNTVYVWDREYVYQKGLFPAQIKAAGQNILNTPISVNLKASGRNILKTASVTSNRIKTSERECSFYRNADSKNVKVLLKSRVEFDGMMWNSLQIIPKKSNVKLDSLSVTVRLNTKNATLMMPHDYTLQNTGKIKKWSGSIRPLWIGDEKRGLCFFAEYSYNWIVKDRQKELEVIPQKDSVLLRINLIATPVKLKKLLEFQFGFMATPIKPIRQDHRKWRFVHKVDPITPEKNVEFLQLPFRKWAKKPLLRNLLPCCRSPNAPVIGEMR